MKAMIMTGFGDTSVLDYQDWPKPTLKPGQVLIKVLACSVNPIDWRIRKGEAKMFVLKRPPMILGADIAGDVVELGPGATHFQVGQPVFAKLRGDIGGYAEYVAVPEEAVALRPANLSAVEAAGVPAGATTALQALRDVGGLKPGQSVLINGASGGVGLFAVQLAKVLGASVTAVCGETGFALVKAMGADEVVDYKKTDFTKMGRRWNVIFDVSATRKFQDCRKAMENSGVYITTISSGGDMLMPLLNPLRSQKGRFILVKASGKDLDYIRTLIEGGRLKTTVDRVFPLQQAAEAQRYMEGGKPRGKIVLNVAA